MNNLSGEGLFDERPMTQTSLGRFVLRPAKTRVGGAFNECTFADAGASLRMLRKTSSRWKANAAEQVMKSRI